MDKMAAIEICQQWAWLRTMQRICEPGTLPIVYKPLNNRTRFLPLFKQQYEALTIGMLGF